MAGQFDDLVGELTPGQSGWLPLDESGTPSGPATISPPPGPDAKACSVKANTQEDVDNGHDALVSSSGAPLIPPLTSNVDRRFPNEGGDPPPPEVLTPAITSLNPVSAPAGVDLALAIAGENLDGATAVDVNGIQSAVDPGGSAISVTTTVLGTSLAEGSANVMVVTPTGNTNQLPMEVTAPVGRGTNEGREGQGRDNRRRYD
jgi:hypothetical protein